MGVWVDEGACIELNVLVSSCFDCLLCVPRLGAAKPHRDTYPFSTGFSPTWGKTTHLRGLGMACHLPPCLGMAPRHKDDLGDVGYRLFAKFFELQDRFGMFLHLRRQIYESFQLTVEFFDCA